MAKNKCSIKFSFILLLVCTSSCSQMNSPQATSHPYIDICPEYAVAEATEVLGLQGVQEISLDDFLKRLEGTNLIAIEDRYGRNTFRCAKGEIERSDKLYFISAGVQPHFYVPIFARVSGTGGRIFRA